MAAPAFRAAAYAGDASTPYRDVTVTKPTGTVENDILIGVMQVGNSSGSVSTPPSGWTQITTDSNTGQTCIAFWKRAGGSEPASYAWNMDVGGGNMLAMSISAFSGCITTGTPFESASFASATAAETTPDTAAVTTTGTDRLVVAVCCIEDNVSFSSGYPPSGSWADRFTATDSGGTDAAVAIMDRTEASATTVSAEAVGTLPSSEWWQTFSFALIPPAAATTSLVPDGRRTPRRRSMQRW